MRTILLEILSDVEHERRKYSCNNLKLTPKKGYEAAFDREKEKADLIRRMIYMIDERGEINMKEE